MVIYGVLVITSFVSILTTEEFISGHKTILSFLFNHWTLVYMPCQYLLFRHAYLVMDERDPGARDVTVTVGGTILLGAIYAIGVEKF